MYAKWIEADGRFDFSRIDNGGVVIADDLHAALIAAQGEGQVIVPDAKGRPIAADPPPPSEAQLWERLRRERDARLAAALEILDRHRNQRDFGLPSTLTTEQATAWAVYAQALRDLPASTTDPASPEWPEAPTEETTE